MVAEAIEDTPQNIESWALKGGHSAHSEIPGHLCTMSKESAELCTAQYTSIRGFLSFDQKMESMPCST